MLGELDGRTFLTMHNEHFFRRLLKRRNPLGQMVSVRMTADTRQINNRCFHMNLLTEQLHLLHSIEKGVAKCSRHLISDKQDRGIRSPQVVL